MTEEVLKERRGAILIVRLNRPDARNAINANVMHGVGTAMIEAESDPELGAVVITGTGDRAFCAGQDLRALGSESSSEVPSDAKEAFGRLMRGLTTVPVIAAVNATAVGGGFEMVLGCDLAIASSEARFGLPEVKRGLLAAGGGVFLATRIPLASALEIALTGDSIDANRALGLGIVNAVVMPDEVLSTAVSYAERIAANGPLAVSATKELVRLAATDAARAEDRLKEIIPAVFGSEDAKEGAAAFIERRPPVWRGR
jgi:enoyl-CoA hydratase/carnithine racemase